MTANFQAGPQELDEVLGRVGVAAHHDGHVEHPQALGVVEGERRAGDGERRDGGRGDGERGAQALGAAGRSRQKAQARRLDEGAGRDREEHEVGVERAGVQVAARGGARGGAREGEGHGATRGAGARGLVRAGEEVDGAREREVREHERSLDEAERRRGPWAIATASVAGTGRARGGARRRARRARSRPRRPP